MRISLDFTQTYVFIELICLGGDFYNDWSFNICQIILHSINKFYYQLNFQYSLLVLKGLFARKRMLLLTEGPHLYYVDAHNKVLKGEIPW